MKAEKLSISMDAELVATVRSAAADDGVSVSNWLADAALARTRQRLLRDVLDELASEVGALSGADVDRLINEARRESVFVQPSAVA